MQTPEQEAAYINAQTACAMIEAMGMAAANQGCAFRGESPAFDDKHFSALIEQYGIHHNAVLTTFRR